MSLSFWQALVKNRKNDTLLCLKWTANKDLLYSTWNSDQCYVVGWMGVVLGRIDMCIRMAESPHCSPETVTALFVLQLSANTK